MITYIQLGFCALLLLTSIILAVGLYRAFESDKNTK
jgi:hypothetical protein